MAKYVAESKWIASIYPGTLWPIIKYVGPHPNSHSPRATRYELKPVPRGGKPFMLEVVDAFENVPNPMKAAESSKADRIGANMIFDSSPVPCEEIAANLIQEWVGGRFGVPSGAAPGIMIVIGTIPTQAELKRMEEMQTAFGEYLFQEGERLNELKQWKDIRPEMRDMAVWLGRDVRWGTPGNATDLIPCPACTKQIPSQSIVCAVCGTRLKALPPDLAKLNQTAAA
jgi:hypothetical protein